MSKDWNPREALEMGEARVLLCTWQLTKQKVLTPVRRAWFERIYGPGSAERISGYMTKLRSGELS